MVQFHAWFQEEKILFLVSDAHFLLQYQKKEGEDVKNCPSPGPSSQGQGGVGKMRSEV